MNGVLRALEAEAIHVFRESVANGRKPVLLYSVGKDSSVLLHLARKAFYPARPPFPLLHIATGWDFADMLAHRDQTAARVGMELLVHGNETAERDGITPFSVPIATYTRLMLIEPLKRALDLHRFDLAFGGGRRDEERSRAKERIYSVRAPGHAWDPRRQRPELWRLANTLLGPGETLRVFPLSNWTEQDIWQYIQVEGIPVVRLYLAAERPVVRRSGALIVRDDARLPLRPGESAMPMLVRFRTLGCYPLTAASESSAATVEAVIAELNAARASERSGRLVDGEADATMEAKKQEGYF